MRSEPRHVYVISFDDANTDLKYFCSHADQMLDGVAEADIFRGNIINASTNSQSLNPIRANATIGGIDFTFLDKDGELTSLLNTKLLAGDGLRAKRVQHWLGEKGAEWSSGYDQIQTHQIHDAIGITNDGIGYRFAGRDIQRSELEDIFEPKVTNTTAAIRKTAITIDVNSTAGIDLIQHGASYSDAPNDEVLYFSIKDEIIRGISKTATVFTVDNASSTLNGAIAKGDTSIVVTDASSFDSSGIGFVTDGGSPEVITEFKFTGKSSNTLTGVTGITNAHNSGDTIYNSKGRGVLGTVADAYSYDSGAANRIKVTEHIYYEIPAMKLAYAILTGVLFGSADVIPAHHTLDIDPVWVSTSHFTQFSDDIWDTADDTAGIRLRFSGLKKTNAKKFIEEDLNFWCGVFNPILPTGELGLKRMTGVISDAAHTGIWNEDNVISIKKARFDLNDVHNNVVISWNHDPIDKSFTRTLDLTDTDSQAAWGKSKTLALKSKGLHGSIHTDNILASMFNTWRDRHAGPPFKASITLDYTERDVKVGDIKRLQLDHIPEFTDQDGNYSSFDASVEVQKVTVNHKAGTVTADIFASTYKAAPLVLGSDSSPLNDAFFTTDGSDISGATTGTLSGGGTIWTIDGNSSITGHDDLSSSSALSDNDTGVFYWDGDLTIAAGVTLTISKNIELRVNGFFTNNGTINGKGFGLAGGTTGQAGHVGITQADGGFGVTYIVLVSAKGTKVEGINSKVGPYVINNNIGNTISGAPTNLQGTSGGKGGDLNIAAFTLGQSGGDGGAGFLVYCKGAAGGINSSVDLSGNDGVDGILSPTNASYSGSGAGGYPGGFVMFLVGNTVTETLSDHFVANVGESKLQGNKYPTQRYTNPSVVVIMRPTHSFYEGYHPRDVSRANLLVDWVPDNLTATSDASPIADPGTVMAFTPNDNVPQTPAENLTTLDVTITPPSDTSYDHSVIVYKLATDTVFEFVQLPSPIAKDETSVVVAMDGAEYTFRAYPVNVDGVMSTDFIEENYTVANATGFVILASGNSVKTDADVPNNGGVQVDSNGIDCYDDSGNKTFDLNAATGDFDVGDITSEKFLRFISSSGILDIGRDTQIRGADAYNNNNIYYHTFFDSLDSWQLIKTANANITYPAGDGIQIDVTGTAVEAGVMNRKLEYSLVTPTFDKTRRFKIAIQIAGTLTNAGGEISWGAVDVNGFWFSLLNGALSGNTALSSSTTTLDLSTTLSVSTTYLLEAVLDADAADVEFFVDGVSKGTITTNIPTGTTWAQLFKISHGKNASGGSEYSEIVFSELKALQEF